MDQPSKIVNPARGHLIFFPVLVRALEFGLVRQVQPSRPASASSFSTLRKKAEYGAYFTASNFCTLKSDHMMNDSSILMTLLLVVIPEARGLEPIMELYHTTAVLLCCCIRIASTGFRDVFCLNRPYV